MKKYIIISTLFFLLGVQAQTTIINKKIDCPILFNDELTYSYFIKFENKMKKRNKYMKPQELDLYAVFIHKGITKKPPVADNKQKGILYRSEENNNVILLPDNSRRSKRKLYRLIKPLYSN